MILECKSCQKKFVVPDNAIPATGRLVQCSSCGNKWTQFPVKKKDTNKPINFSAKKKVIEKPAKIPPKIQKKKIVSTPIKKKKIVKKRSGPSIYSKEYLEKKHGIKINENLEKSKRSLKSNKPSSTSALGFYSYFLIFIVLVLAFFGILNLTKEIIISNIPITEKYINYFYENLDNFLILFKDLFNFY